MRALMIPAVLTALVACDGATEEAPPAEDKCPEIGMDQLAGDWIKVQGSSGDHKTRLRTFEEDGGWHAWYVDGGWRKKVMAGELRAEDLKLTEVPDDTKKAAFEGGSDTLTRLYFQPYKKKCAVRVVEVRVSMTDGDEKEQQVGVGYTEYLPFPDGPQFTYRPCDDDMFIDDAAKDWKVAKKQIEGNGINPVGALGESVPVAAFTDPLPTECTYTFDQFFDDQPVDGGQGVEAKLVGDKIHWYAEWYAPYSGNHHFEIHRYAECDGDKKLLGVSCLEGILD